MTNQAGWFAKYILPWIHRPGIYTVEDAEGNNIEKEEFGERDNIWSDFPIFNDEWIEIMSKKEWYKSPNVPAIYGEQGNIFGNVGLGSPYEESYSEDQDSGSFSSTISATGDLPSGKGSFKFKVDISTKSPPEGENDFALVEYEADAEISYDMPGGGTFMPRFLAYPLNRFYKWAFLKYIGEDMIEYDGEFARQKMYDYFQQLRSYHGEEPAQTKTREARFKPAIEEGEFFQ